VFTGVATPGGDPISMSMGELLLLALVGFIVIGPERLPAAIRAVAGMATQAKQYATAVKDQVGEAADLGRPAPCLARGVAGRARAAATRAHPATRPPERRARPRCRSASPRTPGRGRMPACGS